MEDVVKRLELVADRLERVQAGSVPGPGVPTSGPKAYVPAPSVPRGKPVAFPAGPPPPASAGPAAFVALVTNQAAAVQAAAMPLPAEVQAASKCIVTGFEELSKVVASLKTRCQPKPEELQGVVAGVATQIGAADSLASGRRSASSNHYKAVLEGMQGLAWIAYTGPSCGMSIPPVHAGECNGTADVYLNKVLMEFKQTHPENKPWVLAIKALLAAHQSAIQAHFPNGLVWATADQLAAATESAPATTVVPEANKKVAPAAEEEGEEDIVPSAAEERNEQAIVPQEAEEDDIEDVGTEAEEVVPVPEAEEVTPVPEAEEVMPVPEAEKVVPEAADEPEESVSEVEKTAGGAPPPPPLPEVGQFFKETPTTAAAAPPNFLAELSKGSAVTSGLKKVTDDMKTKNQTDRTATVPATNVPAAKTAPGASTATKKPAKMELINRRWMIEHFDGDQTLVLDASQVAKEHSVYVSQCTNCVLQIKGKVNNLMLDSCKKVGVVFESLLSSCEVVNSNGIQVQCTGSCPTLAIDKSDGIQVYMSRETLVDTEITTAKSSSVNVCVPPLTDEDDTAEHPLPEQFMSRFVDGKFITTPVIHSAG